MAGNARFHDKLHRKNHHTLPTVGYPDSANDPIASPSQPFQGDFVVNGKLSASSGITILSANIEQDLNCENVYVRNTTYTNFISGYGTETIISDGALTGYGDKTLTMDYRSGIYAKTPMFNMLGNLSINQNVSFVGTSAHYIKSRYNNDDSVIVFGGSTTGSASSNIHNFYNLTTQSGAVITADATYDTILPYQERKVVYGSEQVARYFLINGTMTSPLAVADNSTICAIRGFAYSGSNRFNTYGGGGNASIDIRTAGNQSLANCGGYIVFTTMPMNSGTSTGAIERMRITSEGDVGIGTSSPTEELHVSKAQSGGQTIVKVENPSTGVGSQARFDISTGTLNSYVTHGVTEENLNNNYYEIACGPALSGGMWFTAVSSAPIILRQNNRNRFWVAANGNSYVDGMLTLYAGKETQSYTNSNNLSGIYIKFDTSTSELGQAGATDWAYLRQIGTSNRFHLVLDMHDDANGIDAQTFSIRNIGSALNNPDSIQTNFTVNNRGYVGIGLPDPEAKLDIKSEYTAPVGGGAGITQLKLTNSATNYPWMRFGVSMFEGDYNPITKTGDQAIIFSGNVNTGHSLSSNLVIAPHTGVSNCGMRMTYDGKIGIGVSDPTEKLHVVGNVLITGNLSALGDTTQIDTTIVTTSAMVIDMAASTDGLRITQKGTGNALLVEDEASDSSAFVVNSSGDVGIGINIPTTKLHVDGSIMIPVDRYVNFSDNADGHTAIKRNGNDNGLEFFTDSESRMFISDSGNVGIGTKTQLHSPNDKLEVAGNVGAYGYRAKQGIPNGLALLSDSSSNGYAFGDDGDTGMFSPLNGSPENSAIGRIGWYCNNIETARTFVNSQPVFTVGGLTDAWESYGRTTSCVYDFNNGGLLELSDGGGGRGVIYRDAFTNTLVMQGRSSNCGIIIGSKGFGDITLSVSANNNGIVLNDSANVGINTASPEAKLHVVGGPNTMLIESSDQETVIDFKNTSLNGRRWRLGTGGSMGGLSGGVFGLYDVTASTMNWYTSTGSMVINADLRVQNLSGTGNRAVYSDPNGLLTNTSSDGTLKQNVSIISQGLNEVLKLKPVSFNWKNSEKFGIQREIGFIAQEVKPIVPEVVGTNADNTLTVDYPKMIAVLTKAIQELNAKVDAQAAEILALKNKN